MNLSWETITGEHLRHYYCDKQMSDQQIGKLFGVTRNQVSYKRRFYHIVRQVETPEYHKKLVVYLDILGLYSLMQDADQRHQLHDLLTAPFRVRKNSPECQDIQITTFGHALICSLDWQLPDGFDKMCRYLSLLTQALLGYHGYLLRGAIVIGPVCHTEQMVFGPAFAKAQMLEVNMARYPRIIIDMHDLHQCLHTCPAATRQNTKKKFVYSDDGFYYMDGFYHNKQQPHNIMLQRAREKLSTMSVETRIERERVDWMKHELERCNL